MPAFVYLVRFILFFVKSENRVSFSESRFDLETQAV